MDVIDEGKANRHVAVTSKCGAVRAVTWNPGSCPLCGTAG